MTFDILQEFAMRILTNGMYVSALNGLLVFIVGMIIVHFTPENDGRQKRELSK